MKSFVNPKDFAILTEAESDDVEWSTFELPDAEVTHYDGLLTPYEVAALIETLNEETWLPVGVNGMTEDYQTGDPVGNYRVSQYSEAFARTLWERIQGAFPETETFEAPAPFDNAGHSLWKAVGVNPLFRFIRYEPGGQLVPHYDAPYVESSTHRTLRSLVVYLEGETRGGETVFLKDSQVGVPVSERVLTDGSPDDMVLPIFTIPPLPGTGISFPHRVWHCAGQNFSRKTIFRTDILYAKA